MIAMMGKATDLRARCWAIYTDHNVPHGIKQVMLEVVKMIDFEQRQNMRREVNRKREQDRRAKETPEQAAARREKNRLRMAAKRAAK